MDYSKAQLRILSGNAEYSMTLKQDVVVLLQRCTEDKCGVNFMLKWNVFDQFPKHIKPCYMPMNMW